MIDIFKGLSLAWKVVVTLFACVFIFLAYNFVDDVFFATDEKEAEVAQNQGEAAVQAGQDTANAVADQFTREIYRTENTERIIERIEENSDDYVATHFIGAQRLCDNSGICGLNVVQSDGAGTTEGSD